jgi:hypothetical protein
MVCYAIVVCVCCCSVQPLGSADLLGFRVRDADVSFVRRGQKKAGGWTRWGSKRFVLDHDRGRGVRASSDEMRAQIPSKSTTTPLNCCPSLTGGMTHD